MSAADPLDEALRLPGGARFYRCALQVNPFGYFARVGKKPPQNTEDEYNDAVVQGCKDNAVEIVGLADHHSVKSAESLMGAMRAAGIEVFPGFEAGSKDGVHILCLFSPTTDLQFIDGVISRLGVLGRDKHQPACEFYLKDLLQEVHQRDGVCIAAHADQSDGLLGKLTGTARANAWKERLLLAAAIRGAARDAGDDLRQILAGTDPQYRRDTPIALLNAQDVCSREDLAKPGASCWIKMSEISVSGLRQAFLDPASRIRLATDDVPVEHSEIVAVAWTSGMFLDGASIHFNANLNVLIGGRGTGKSTIIESIRYALAIDPIGDEAQANHSGIVQNVLRNGTKISLLVRTYRPDVQTFRIERTVPNPPVVRDAGGRVLTRTPVDLLPGIDVYGQHEISELTKNAEKRTKLLDRFVRSDPDINRRKGEVRKQLERSRRGLADSRRELAAIDERLASLPKLEETLAQLQASGLEEKLKDRSVLVKEQQIVKTAGGRIDPIREIVAQLSRGLPIDVAFVSDKALKDLPGANILQRLAPTLERLTTELQAAAKAASTAIHQADDTLAEVKKDMAGRERVVQTEYDKLLRELQRTRIDGAELIQIRQQIEELRPLAERKAFLQREVATLLESRLNLRAEWVDVRGHEFRQLEKASKTVTNSLQPRVRVSVTQDGDRSRLVDFLGRFVQGRRSEAVDALRSVPQLSLVELADACRTRKAAQKYGIPPAQAEKLCDLAPEALDELEELDLLPTTHIWLNVGSKDVPEWRRLEDLSTGQKATAVLLLLLLDSEAPLIVDQPEDDLDNRFITEGVVPRMKDEKRRRQFLFATHNANIPVLGDAELIVGLSPVLEGSTAGKDAVPPDQMGSIDSKIVREMVEEVLEGGREAFEMRRLKYGF